MKTLLCLALLLAAFTASAQDDAPETMPRTVGVTLMRLQIIIGGRSAPIINQHWPAVLVVRSDATMRPDSYYLEITATDGKTQRWPWRKSVVATSATQTLFYWTLAPDDTATIPVGNYHFSLSASGTKGRAVAALDATVAVAPVGADGMEQADAELAYFRAIGDAPAALLAAKRRFDLAPDSTPARIDYARCLIDVGRAPEARDLARAALAGVKDEGEEDEPPIALLDLQSAAEAAIKKSKP